MKTPILLLEWPDDVTRLSGDGGESLSEWDRNRIQDERDKEEQEWHENERSRAATADADEEF